MNERIALRVERLCAFAGSTAILRDIHARFPAGQTTVIVGPSGAGKSTLLRCINRLAQDSDRLRVTGRVYLGDAEILDGGLDPNLLRQRVGMVFQRPCVFPTTISGNVLYGLRHLRLARRRDVAGCVERLLREVALWDEVKDRLHRPARVLSAGQQQRLCVARALSMDPEVLLMDEPTSALDPYSARMLEALVTTLATTRTVVLVSHDLAQARRVGDQLIFLQDGQVIEQDRVQRMFENPRDDRTRRYLAGLG